MDLCQFLIQEGVLDHPACAEIKQRGGQTGLPLVRLVGQALGLSDLDLAHLLAIRAHHPFCDLQTVEPEQDALRLLPEEQALSSLILPLRIVEDSEGSTLVVAVADPFSKKPLEELRRICPYPVAIEVASLEDLQAAITQSYSSIVTRIMATPPLEAPSPSPPLRERPARGFVEPSTVPSHNIEDDLSPSLRVQALVDLLVERGWITREEYVAHLRRLLEEGRIR